jgi:peroxiredoxin
LAKPFSTLDVFGRPVRLEDYAGQMVLLWFYRNAACALCNLHLKRLIEWYKARPEAVQVLAVFESPAGNILDDHPGQQQPPFPLIPDPAGGLYELYGLESSESKVMASLAQPQTQRSVEEAARLGFALRREEGSNFNRLTAEFLIGPDQTIRLAHYAGYVGDHASFEEIERLLG